MSGAPGHGASPDGAGSRARLALVCWNLRYLGLFLVGPVFGVILAGGLFGMTAGLYWAAGVVFALVLSMYAVLFRGEWRRIAEDRDPSRRPC